MCCSSHLHLLVSPVCTIEAILTIYMLSSYHTFCVSPFSVLSPIKYWPISGNWLICSYYVYQHSAWHTGCAPKVLDEPSYSSYDGHHSTASSHTGCFMCRISLDYCNCPVQTKKLNLSPSQQEVVESGLKLNFFFYFYSLVFQPLSLSFIISIW